MSNLTQGGEAIPLTEEVIGYVQRFGGKCRDCADEDGVCPSSGLACGGSEKAIRHVIKALNYGTAHGFLTHKSTEEDRLREALVTQDMIDDAVEFWHSTPDKLLDEAARDFLNKVFARLALSPEGEEGLHG